jgi:hypothetical protein
MGLGRVAGRRARGRTRTTRTTRRRAGAARTTRGTTTTMTGKTPTCSSWAVRLSLLLRSSMGSCSEYGGFLGVLWAFVTVAMASLGLERKASTYRDDSDTNDDDAFK